MFSHKQLHRITTGLKPISPTLMFFFFPLSLNLGTLLATAVVRRGHRMDLNSIINTTN